METQEYLSGLNDQQKIAVLHKDGPLLIIAGAGAGKTKTVTHRIAHLMKQGTAGENILAVTFTNKAAKEMRERIESLLGDSIPLLSRPFVSTFHSLGVHIIKENAQHFGLTKHFSILDESDAISLIKEAIVANNIDPKQHDPKKFRYIISRQKGELISAEDFGDKASSYTEELVAKVWRGYESLKQKERALDFDDLLLKAVLLLKQNPEVLKRYQDRFQFIHIDEYQDTNKVQYELTRLLARAHQNICVVGDGDQNIYSWRGANMKNILNFERDYPDTTTVLLEENYRSTQTILEAANEIIKKNVYRKDKQLFTSNGLGEKITLYEAYDEGDEARFVARTVQELINQNYEPKDIAVLYRANFQSRILEEAFLQQQIPYHVLGVKFFDRKEIKDVLSYIKAAMNKESLSDIKRIINVPARGIGKATIAKIFADKVSELPAAMQRKIADFYEALDKIAEFAPTNKVSETIKYAIQVTGLEHALANGTDEEKERLENIQELVTLSLRYDEMEGSEGLEKMLEDAALATDQDSLMKTGNAVRLMTVHASKGLEFKVVFIVGIEQGLFPHDRNSNAKPEDAEEERRLFYVALTRAGLKLYISYATIRTLFGNRQINAPGEFLYDLPEHLVDREYARNNNSGTVRTIYLD